jgi:hypothetical protein
LYPAEPVSQQTAFAKANHLPAGSRSVLRIPRVQTLAVTGFLRTACSDVKAVQSDGSEKSEGTQGGGKAEKTLFEAAAHGKEQRH